MNAPPSSTSTREQPDRVVASLATPSDPYPLDLPTTTSEPVARIGAATLMLDYRAAAARSRDANGNETASTGTPAPESRPSSEPAPAAPLAKDRAPSPSATVMLSAANEHVGSSAPNPAAGTVVLKRADFPSTVSPPKPATALFPPASRPPRATPKAQPGARRLFERPRMIALAVGIAVSFASLCGVAAAASRKKPWLAPTVLSSTDARVLEVAATLQQEKLREKELSLKKLELEARIREAKRWQELERAFQASYKAALRADLETGRAELRRLQGILIAAYAADDAEVTKGSSELQVRLGALRQRIRLLEDVSRDGREGTLESLALRREYDRSLAGLDKTTELEGALVKALGDVNEALAQKTALIASIEKSPYGLAIAGDVALGFVPYENLADVKPGDPIFACKTTLLFCERVGEVGELLNGEVRGADPSSGRELRGQLVRISLSDARSVQRSRLYAHRKPLF